MKRLPVVHARPGHRRSNAARSAGVWWNDLPTPVRSTRWVVMFCSLAIVALLLGFHHVVKTAVAQGELLRMNTATRAQAEWRCHALKVQSVREDCLRQLDAPPIQVADKAPPNWVSTQVAQR